MGEITHSTWAKTFYCRPEKFLQPQSLEQIQQIVRDANRANKTIMVVGSGHSPSRLTMTNDWLVNLDKFNQPLSFVEHPSGKFTDVTVEAGMRIYQLNELLASRGLALQNLGSISEQSVAGIISTGTHGASAYHGLVSQQIVDLSLVIGSGDVIKCSPQDNPDLFRAACLSLGKLGIIVHATIRAIPAYTIRSTQEVVSFEKFLTLWPTFWTSSEYLRVWWFPYSRRCILWRANKSSDPLSEPRSSWYGTRLGRLFYESLLWISVKILPSLTPFIEKFVFSKQYGLTDTYENGSHAVQNSVEGLNMDCLFSQFVNEWGLPLENGVDILKQIDQVIEKARKTKQYYVHAPIEVRCSNTTVSGSFERLSESQIEALGPKNHKGAIPGNNLRPLLDWTPKLEYVSSADQVSNSNLTLFINATMYRPFGTNSPISQWFRDFEDIVEPAGGKPHWAKNFVGRSSQKTLANDMKTLQDPNMIGLKDQLQGWYGEDLKIWQNIRLTDDPSGVFLSGKNWAEINGFIGK